MTHLKTHSPSRERRMRDTLQYQATVKRLRDAVANFGRDAITHHAELGGLVDHAFWFRLGIVFQAVTNAKVDDLLELLRQSETTFRDPEYFGPHTAVGSALAELYAASGDVAAGLRQQLRPFGADPAPAPAEAAGDVDTVRSDQFADERDE